MTNRNGCSNSVDNIPPDWVFHCFFNNSQDCCDFFFSGEDCVAKSLWWRNSISRNRDHHEHYSTSNNIYTIQICEWMSCVLVIVFVSHLIRLLTYLVFASFVQSRPTVQLKWKSFIPIQVTVCVESSTQILRHGLLLVTQLGVPVVKRAGCMKNVWRQLRRMSFCDESLIRVDSTFR